MAESSSPIFVSPFVSSLYNNFPPFATSRFIGFVFASVINGLPRFFGPSKSWEQISDIQLFFFFFVQPNTKFIPHGWRFRPVKISYVSCEAEGSIQTIVSCKSCNILCSNTFFFHIWIFFLPIANILNALVGNDAVCVSICKFIVAIFSDPRQPLHIWSSQSPTPTAD